MNDDLTVFISYRRADSSADAGRLYDALRRRFGRENIFMDVDSLRPGEDWVEAVEAAVTRSDVLLAIIGPAWVGAKDEQGESRLGKELDRVRLEIEAALRNGKPVIPVLVEGASMPTSAELPESLKPLLRRHAIRISHSTFESDLSALVRALRTIDKQRHPKPASTAAGSSIATTAAATAAAASAPPTPTSAPATPPPPVVVPPPPPTQTFAPQPPITPADGGYAAPAVQPVYPTYPAPAYNYSQAQPQKRNSPLLLGLAGLVTVAVVGFLLMAVLHVGPFAVTALATATPTLEPTDQPTDQPTDAPTDQPTDQPTATGSLGSPTPLPSRTPYPESAFSPIWAVVPTDVADSCEETSTFDVPQLFCFVTSGEQSFSFWYAAYPDVDSLNASYDGWLQYRKVAREVANCFDVSLPLPCEGPYKVNGYDPAGRVAGVVADGSWMYWTHEPAMILGYGYASADGGVPFADMFTYWENTAGGLTFPSPTPSP